MSLNTKNSANDILVNDVSVIIKWKLCYNTKPISIFIYYFDGFRLPNPRRDLTQNYYSLHFDYYDYSIATVKKNVSLQYKGFAYGSRHSCVYTQ